MQISQKHLWLVRLKIENSKIQYSLLYTKQKVFMEQPAITSDEALEENKIQKYLIIPATTNKECNKNLFTKISG